jgi:hypothetical protein
MLRGLIIALILSAGIPAFAQTKTITNSDLEKYRTKRLAAERDLRENYESMGFPSPDELERLNEESRRERAEFAENYRQQQIERERIEAESGPSQVFYYVPQTNGRSYGSYYYGGFAPLYYYGNRYVNRTNRYRKPGPGYINNQLIRSNWLRQSAPMRNTYRGNFRNSRSTPRTNPRRN